LFNLSAGKAQPIPNPYVPNPSHIFSAGRAFNRKISSNISESDLATVVVLNAKVPEFVLFLVTSAWLTLHNRLKYRNHWKIP